MNFGENLVTRREYNQNAMKFPSQEHVINSMISFKVQMEEVEEHRIETWRGIYYIMGNYSMVNWWISID